ncbi:MAG: bifunctional adenosylcobinamide kinase/adenosylcobinamide-phosphate guanylyltransferase [Lachnospiraceae bacterium]
MILIFGGAYQGKTAYAAENFPNMKPINNYHTLVHEQILAGINPSEYLLTHLEEYRDCVIICDDISSGIVPLDATMRSLREEVGRALSILSKESDAVYRIFCGLPLQLK